MRSGKTRTITYSALFTALIIAGSFLRIPLPGGIPFTMQIFFIFIAAAYMGSRGWLPVLLYVVLGLVGLPVFSGGGGPAYLLHPTFGYIAGFIPASFFIAAYFDDKSPRIKRLGVLLTAIIIVYILGCMWLYVVKNMYLSITISLQNVIKYGMLVFLPYDFLKAVLALFLLEKLNKLKKG